MEAPLLEEQEEQDRGLHTKMRHPSWKQVFKPLNNVNVPTHFQIKSLVVISLIAAIWEASVVLLNSNFHRQKKHQQK